MLSVERLAETAPLRLIPALVDLIKGLGCGPARHLPVMFDEGARTDSCVLNVRTAIERWGGSIRFGWLLRECPDLWISAEFHAVRETAAGLLVDETPMYAPGERHALFAPDPSYSSDFDFRRRPKPSRRRIYRPSAARCQRFAGRAADSLSDAIDNFLELRAEIDALFAPALRGNECLDPARMRKLYESLDRAQRRLLRLLEAHEADPSFVIGFRFRRRPTETGICPLAI